MFTSSLKCKEKSFTNVLTISLQTHMMFVCFSNGINYIFTDGQWSSKIVSLKITNKISPTIIFLGQRNPPTYFLRSRLLHSHDPVLKFKMEYISEETLIVGWHKERFIDMNTRWKCLSPSNLHANVQQHFASRTGRLPIMLSSL